jgi:hypothetical protein
MKRRTAPAAMHRSGGLAAASTQLGVIPGKLELSSIRTDQPNPGLTAALATRAS